MAYTNDRVCINYAFITCLLYCASDVNVIFKMFSDLLSIFKSKRLSHMTASVCSQYK